MENVRQRRDIKLLTTEKRSYYLVSELDYDTTKFFKLCYMDIVYINADYIYKDIAQDVETRFDTSYYELDRPLPKEKKN